MNLQFDRSPRRYADKWHFALPVALLVMLVTACSRMESEPVPKSSEPTVTVVGQKGPAEDVGSKGAASPTEPGKVGVSADDTLIKRTDAEPAKADRAAADKLAAIEPAAGAAGGAGRTPASTDDRAGRGGSGYAKKTEPPPPRPPPPPVKAKPEPTKLSDSKKGEKVAKGKSEKTAAQPDGFPWPPPQPSGLQVLSTSLLATALKVADASKLAASGKTLRDLNRALTDALDQVDYTDRSYFTVPGGYALVTRLESIEPDGTPKAGSERWALESPGAASFSLSDYLARLFSAKPGLYRVIVFVITQQPFKATGKPPTAEEAKIWLSSGYNVLPPQVAGLPYTDEVACTALIYEFEKAPAGNAQIKRPGRIPAQQHLQRNRFISALGG